MIFDYPIPENMLQVLWLGLGIVFARSFGKSLDEDIQESGWFSSQGVFTQNVVKRLLDVLHHWWMGLALIVYSAPFMLFGYHVNLNQELFWMGWGIFYDDLPDLPIRIQGYFGVDQKDAKYSIYNKLKSVESPVTPNNEVIV